MYFKNEEEYVQYLERNKLKSQSIIDSSPNQNFFHWSQEGEVLLTQSKAQQSKKDMSDYAACLGWIVLDDGKTMALIKNFFGDIYRGQLTEEEYYIAMYNNVLLPEIAIQLKNRTAEYYFAKRGISERDKRRFILTKDFKKEYETLKEGKEILRETNYEENELLTENLLFSIEDYLLENGYSEEEINRIKKDFIKQTFFNRFINQVDEHNGNWGILIDDRQRRAKIAPLYDLDCSCNISKKSKIQRKNKDGSTNIYGLMNQYKNEQWFKIYAKEVIESFDLEKAFQDTKEYTNVEIPGEYKGIYRRFFKEKMQEVKTSYEKIFEKEKENEGQDR